MLNVRDWIARKLPPLVPSILLLCLLVWYTAGAQAVLTSGDDYAYVGAAVDIATGRSLVHHFDSPILRSQYNAIPGEPGAYASKYPPGVSLLLVPLYLVGGFSALFWLGPLMGVLGVYALYRLALQVGGDRAISLLAASILATLPAVVFMTSGIGSDLPSLAFVTMALAVYAREVEEPSAHGFWVFSALSGAGVWIREPNVLVPAAVTRTKRTRAGSGSISGCEVEHLSNFDQNVPDLVGRGLIT